MKKNRSLIVFALIGIIASCLMITGAIAEVSNTLSDNEIELFNNWNTATVGSGPSSYPTFTINSPFMISYIETYHWNSGKGKNLGSIALKHSDGTTYGPWDAKRPYWKQSDDNTYWVVEPHEVVKAGKYSIIDSDPQTWSYNSQSDNNGFASVKGMKVPDSSESKESDISGKWNINENNQKTVMVIKQTGNTFSGMIFTRKIIDGKINGDKLTFKKKYISKTSEYSGTIKEDSNGEIILEGTYTEEPGGKAFKWKATRM